MADEGARAQRSAAFDLLLGVAGEEQQQLATLAPSSGASRHFPPLRRRRAAFRGWADYVRAGVLARNHFLIVAQSRARNRAGPRADGKTVVWGKSVSR